MGFAAAVESCHSLASHAAPSERSLAPDVAQHQGELQILMPLCLAIDAWPGPDQLPACPQLLSPSPPAKAMPSEVGHPAQQCSVPQPSYQANPILADASR